MSWPPIAAATRVILVRHGEAAIEAGRICGRLDPPLSREGRAGLARVARSLAGTELAAVYASPLRRAVGSARILAAGRGLGIERVDALQEVDFGALEGLTWDEAQRRFPETCREWLERPHEVAFPGGERFEDVRRRATAALSSLRANHPGRTILVVAHAGVNRAILAEALGAPPAAAFRIDQAPGAVNVVDWVGESAWVRLVNGLADKSSLSGAPSSSCRAGAGRRSR